MKLLKRMLLIKWYYIEHELIEFDTINFMTGKNSSGKSTIIDALQIIMLGDTRGTFFNKAAKDKGGRTLDGYLRGELGDDGDIGFKYKRNGRFTSYIAAEFFDTTERKYFTCGIVFDSYKDAPTDHMFFILNDQIPENHFIDEESKTPMDYRKLKVYLANNYKSNKFSTFKESNKAYQNEFLAKMGALKPKFFNIFKKSVSFTPIDDIEGFISEYVCDVTNEIDIEKMKENIRHYKQLEKEALLMGERKIELDNIEKIFLEYKEYENKEQIQKYLNSKVNLEILKEEYESAKSRFELNEKDIEKLRIEEKEIDNKILELNNMQEEKKQDKARSDINQKNEKINQKLIEIKRKLEEINNKTSKIINIFRNKIYKWRINLNELLEKKSSIGDNSVLQAGLKLKDNLEYLLSINEQNIESFDEEVLNEIKDQMGLINKFSNEMYYNINAQELKLKEEQEKLRSEVEDLKQGVKPYKHTLIEFKNKLKKELEIKFSENVNVEILADLLEIKDLKWKSAIECYMNQQMFYLILEPKYYEEASRIYRNIAREWQYYGFGIVDIESIQKTNPNVEPNSLSEELEIDNLYARTYINYLLGRVIKCEEVEDLRKYKTAITSDCMLYKNYVLRKIFDKNNEFKFIGKKSIEEQIKIKQEKIDEIEQKINHMKKIKDITYELKNAQQFNDDEIKDRKEDIKLIRTKQSWVIEQNKYELELKQLDLTWLINIDKEINDLENKIDKLDKEKRNKHDTRIGREHDNNILKNEKIPDFAGRVTEKEKDILNKFNAEWVITYGIPEFEKESKIKRLKVLEKTSYEAISSLEKKKENEYNKLVKVRNEYIQKYQFSYNTLTKENNAEFSDELKKISEIQLPEYLEKIKDSKEKAYQQFREDFISKLKANIDEVENQVEELNTALKNSTFGVDQYQFKVKPKQEYKKFYEMITDDLLMEGFNLMSDTFNSKYHDEIDELFKKLTSSDVSDESYNKNISIYTDYKTYLSFDLIVTDKEGNTQRLSRTLDKKSGGETQTPFYISVLASFAQLYRISKNRNDNTLRLIVFDEAFNKMDEDRMGESLKLLSKFGFQAIFAAPSEKAGEIIPLVPNTLCVIRKGTSTIVRKWEKDRDF